MKKINPLLTIVFTVSFLLQIVSVSAQKYNLQAILNQVKPSASNTVIHTQSSGFSSDQPHLSQFFQFNENVRSHSIHVPKKATGTSDTIYVGIAPYDSLVITGTYSHTGPIIVVLNGVLIIKNANVTNLGDMYAIQKGKIIIDSSTVSFPQNYFYQRSLVLVGTATATISNTTLSYGGYSHNLSVYDTAQITFRNVTQPDWMTSGIGSHASLTINGTNQAGEFIISDYCNINIKNATSVLLWHQFPDSSVINWSFGKHDTAYGYKFNNSMPGVKGIEYNVSADSCYSIMWAMMPSSGSNINVTNSKIRSIGLWFDKPKDSVIVSGITDNATYAGTFNAPLSDRTFTLTNCTVQTWSFYVFHKSIINVSGCIAGEIGTENSSKMYGSGYVVDGSGGYHWSSDTSTIVAGNATVTSYVRSEKSSLFIFAYSTIGGSGYAEAIDNSILIVVQSTVPIDPQALDGSDAWFDNINQSGNMFADSVAPVNGSAWIHRGPTSNWMYFKSWQLFYQPNGDTGWTAITGIDTTEVSNNLLANWNTHGLNSGTYDLDLRLTDSYNNSVDAIKQVTLLPLILGVNEIKNISEFSIYPNPAKESITIDFTSTKSGAVQIELTDISGRQVLISKDFVGNSGRNMVQLNTSDLAAGTYICSVTVNGSKANKLIEISK
ncbi:MAG TPA: T9SS type A sorting domain-containing protein [Bacteroidia bacterium]|jgi:hypothetical protein|nr:T9SS type A sorting domain-containing protein [Bacteroidia bacterium]